MPTPVEDYRWQDHVPRLGAIDLTVAIVTAAILLMTAMADRPSGSRGSAGLALDAVTLLVADTSLQAAVTPAGCDGRRAEPWEDI